MRLGRRILLFLLLLGSTSPVFSAGFDCDRAQSNVEKIVCGNSLVSSLDKELSVAYRKLLRKVSNEAAENIEKEQRNWLKHVRDACADEECLLQAYTQRLSVFMPSACTAKGEMRSAISRANERIGESSDRVCTDLEYVIDPDRSEALIASFNQALGVLGGNNLITSCERILQLNQVTLTGYSRTYRSYGALCQIGNRTVEVCDYPMVGKFTMKLDGYSGGTLDLAEFIMKNCPLGG